MGGLVGRGGVGLLGGQLAVVVTAIQTLGVRGTAEIFLKHTKLSVTYEGLDSVATLLTQFLRVSGILPTMALLTSLAAISLSSMAAASL